MDQKKHTIELVVYSLKANPVHNQEIILEQTRRGLAKLAGFVHRKVYQAADEPALLMDWVAWDTLANAVHAAKSMNTVPELTDFTGLIASTQVFDHFQWRKHHSVNDKPTEVIELVVYQVKTDQNHQIDQFFDTYSTELAQAPGYHHRTLLQSAGDENRWAERVCWESLASAQENEKTMRQNTRLAGVFSLVERVVIMKHFRLWT